MNYIEFDEKIKRAFLFQSKVNQKAYKDLFLISNEVLSKNPLTNDFLNKFLNNTPVKTLKFYIILNKLIKYYFFSIKDFKSYILEFIEFYLVSYKFIPSEEKELILIDSFFLIKDINKEKGYSDPYFPGLADLLMKMKKFYAYLPVFYGMKRHFVIYKLFKILKRNNIPVLSEYQLLSIKDLLYLLYFIVVYPFRVIKFSFALDSNTHENYLLKNELILTLDQITFRSFARYLQGRKIATLSNYKIKVISWYENQAIDKNLYKGLRINRGKVTIYGAQTFIYSKNSLNINPDENEVHFGIVPDRILVNGPWFIPERSSLNYVLGSSFRYSEIFKSIVKKENKKNILIALPYYKDWIETILSALKDLDYLNLSFLVKAHPSTKIGDYVHLISQRMKIVNENIYVLLNSAKLLISGGDCGVLVEAASSGIPVISITNSKKINFNPLPEYGKGIIWEVAHNSIELGEKINKFEKKFNTDYSEIENISLHYRRNLFCEPNIENIINAFELRNN